MLTGQWRIELLGGVRARRGDERVERFRRSKDAGLLAFLAHHRAVPHSREHLAERFWPEAAPKTQRILLRGALSALRRRLEPPGTPAGTVLEADRLSIRFRPGAVTTDVALFEDALERAGRTDNEAERAGLLSEAVLLWQGEFLRGYEDTWDEWILGERQRLADTFRDALSGLSEALERIGHSEQAVMVARRAVALEPLDDETNLFLMRLHARMGKAGEALRHYQRLRRHLRRTTAGGHPARRPGANLTELASTLRRNPDALLAPPVNTGSRVEAELVTGKVDLGSPPAQPPAWLPPISTPSFGRDVDIGAVCRLVRRHRLVTLTGPGGVGKTRLAVEAATRHQRETSALSCFVPVSDLFEVTSLAAAIRDRIPGSADTGAEPLDQVVAALSGRAALLVLDGFERLAEAGEPFLRTLLERLPLLRCLVASRREIGVAAETVYAVAPLAVPAAPASPVELLNNPSVGLFVERAQRVRPDFQLTNRNAAAAAAICVRLEGLPLAIELAAAQVSRLPLPRIALGLEERFRALVHNNRGGPERHRSLQAAMDWSFDLLPEHLRVFFPRLSVFRGGWTVEAAEQVCSTLQAAEALEELRRHSLVRSDDKAADNGEVSRFIMLDTLREYGQERLAERGPETSRRNVHLEFYLVLAEENGQPESGQAVGLAHLAHDLDNFRAALGWAVQRDLTKGQRLAAALWPLWEAHGRWQEGMGWAEALLDPARSSSVPQELQARLVTCLGTLACRRGLYDLAVPALHEALSLWRALDERIHVGKVLSNLGVVSFEQRDYGAAAQYLEEARSVQQAAGDRAGLAKTVNNLAIIAWSQGDFAAAQVRYEEALALHRETHNDNGAAGTLNNLGSLLKDQGDLEAAKSCFHECQGLFERLGSRWQLAYVLSNLGDIAAKQEDAVWGQFYYSESLTILLEHDDRRAVLVCVEGLGGLASSQGWWEKAAWLFGAGAGLRAELDAPLTPVEASNYAPVLAQIRDMLGGDQFDAVYETSRGVSLEEAVHQGLS